MKEPEDCYTALVPAHLRPESVMFMYSQHINSSFELSLCCGLLEASVIGNSKLPPQMVKVRV